MTPFELAEPKSLREAVGLLSATDPAVRPIAGGTALMLMMKSGVFRPTRLVSLRAIEKEHSAISAGGAGGLKIGAMLTLAALERSADVRREAPVITQALRRLSNIRVRNVATVGGHLAHADPHMDLPPVLIALGASVTVIGPQGRRTIAVEDLFAGYFETTLARNELIAEVVVPPQSGRRSAYLKCTTRSVDDWPALGVAVSVGSGGARVVVSAATEKAARMRAAETEIGGTEIGDAAIARASDAAAAEAAVIDDVRGSAAYKRELVRVYVGRALRAALDGKSGASP
jgi:carbon-monoxide dehydrogenase medium subunit